jgi:DUF4097 and DUF4098 domain-containing protein YvlB
MFMKLSLYAAVLALAIALFTPIQAAGEESRVESFNISPGQTLTFDMRYGGSLTLEGWDKSSAQVTYNDRWGDLDDYDIKMKTTSKGLEITGQLRGSEDRKNSLHFDVKVPRKFNLDFETMGGGLTLVNLEGTFTGRTMGGALELRGVKGEVQLRTGGGRIEVRDCEVDGRIATGGGKVLIEDVVGDLRAKSGGGNVQYINVRGADGERRSPGDRIDAPISRKTVLISSAGGGIDIREAPEGASLRTGGGDISVRGAARFVDAWTGGGDVDIRIDYGWVEVFTGAGDIDVTVESSSRDAEGDIKIFTGTGDVSVTVPKGFSMDLDLDLGYTRSSNRNFKISSNLDFDEEITSEWDSSHGTPRKHIYGTGSLNGGRNKIQIQTTNGNIRLFEEK